MADDPRTNIESYVSTALRSRLDEAARAIGALRDDLTAAVSRVEEQFRSAGDTPLTLPEALFPPPPAAPPPQQQEGALLSHITASQRDLLAAGDQISLLTQLLLACTVSCPRVAFFIVKKDSFAGWAARGFPEAQDADVRGLSIGIAEDTILGAAFRSGSAVRAASGSHRQDSQILGRLGGATPAESLAAPIWIRDKVAAVLYGDSGQDEAIHDPELPEILASYAGLCLETLATRQKYPRPRPGASTSGPELAVTPKAAPPPSIDPTPAKTAAVAPPAQDSSTGGFFQQPSPAAPPPRPSVQAPPDAGLSMAPSRAVTAGPSLESLPEEDRKLHEEARRFARLLVSEIVLYNERQVEEGRRSKDIYERLKEDIDRSRSMYEQRISAKVRSSSNYFYQELLRTLANGDESAIKVPWA
jgi:hypothetical protein